MTKASQTQPILIVAHPGHELVILGWIEELRPVVNILSDGSGRSGASRLPSSLRVLRDAAAEPGPILAAFSDRECYDGVLDGHVEMFVDLAIRLADEFVERRPPYVVGDAREGINPVHDICRAIIDAAVARAARHGVTIPNLEFSLFAPHARRAREARERGIYRILGQSEHRRKIETARAYAELASEVEWALSGSSRKLMERYPELAAILDEVIAGMNENSFATECLLPVSPAADGRAFYELYGERLVADGTYARAIRYSDHVRPIERALASI